jgi:hypothetical protein
MRLGAEAEVCAYLQTCDTDSSIRTKEPKAKRKKNWRFYICVQLEITSLTEEEKFELQLTIFFSKANLKIISNSRTSVEGKLCAFYPYENH